jgi:hypothetical protein
MHTHALAVRHVLFGREEKQPVSITGRRSTKICGSVELFGSLTPWTKENQASETMLGRINPRSKP